MGRGARNFNYGSVLSFGVKLFCSRSPGRAFLSALILKASDETAQNSSTFKSPAQRSPEISRFVLRDSGFYPQKYLGTSYIASFFPLPCSEFCMLPNTGNALTKHITRLDVSFLSFFYGKVFFAGNKSMQVKRLLKMT